MPSVFRGAPDALSRVYAANAAASGARDSARMKSQGDILSAETAGRALVGGEQAGAIGDALSAFYGGLGNAYSGMYGGMGQAEGSRYGALAGLAGAMSQDAANRYGAYSAAEASRQQAMANEASNRYAANAMAEAARQTTLGNLGSASIGAYGSAAGQAMQAWALNQQAYNQAMGSALAANQQAASQYGIGRNSALATLGTAAADAGGRLGAASAIGNLSAEFGGDFGGGGGSSGGGFSVGGPDGQLATGSYGGAEVGSTDGGFYGRINRSNETSSVPGVLDRTFGSIDATRDAIMSGGPPRLNTEALSGQHSSSRRMPMEMQRNAFENLQALGDQYLEPVSLGMDQYYYNSNLNRPDFSSGMNQFYDAMGRAQTDYGGVLGSLATPTVMEAPDFGPAPTLSGVFGDEAMGRSAMDELGPMAGLILSREVQQRDRNAAQEEAHRGRIRDLARRQEYRDATAAQRQRQMERLLAMSRNAMTPPPGSTMPGYAPPRIRF